MPSFENIESFGYALLQLPIEALNIVYPTDGLEELVKTSVSKEEDTESTDRNLYISSNEITGTKGLQRMMSYVDSKNPPEKGSFEYRDEKKYGRIFLSMKLVNIAARLNIFVMKYSNLKVLS